MYCLYYRSCLNRRRGSDNFSPLEMNCWYYLHPSWSIFPTLYLLDVHSLRSISHLMEKPFYSSSLQIDPAPLLGGNGRFPTNSIYEIGAGVNPLTSNEEGKSAEWKRTVVARYITVLDCVQHTSLYLSLSKHQSCWMKCFLAAVCVLYVCVYCFISHLNYRVIKYGSL